MELKLLDKSYNHRFIKDYSFNKEEQSYLDSKFNLSRFMDSETPLIDLMQKGQRDLVNHFLYDSSIMVDPNEEKQDLRLFICFVQHYLSIRLEELSRRYIVFQDGIMRLFFKGYKVKEQDFEFMKQFNAYKDSRQLQYIMLASYALKLADPSLILVMIKNIELMTSLTIIKTGKHIGFYKTTERQILKTRSSSPYQREIINYITKFKKTEFEDIKNKLLEGLRNKHVMIEDKRLRYIINRLI
ncbi:hypothetical protein [Psychroflexus lacisalsi]|uniref:Uncharacterized protein n=1 Tax=Psychroflexus lacisalsi TaxID=503928 RepID=A0ABP3VL58_9FLAO|nr:hypothetical protein [Psychroflexus lacisalsi]MBZ9620133.1 hypothetical protein [Psychroflexus lacisalsi]